MLKRSTTPGAFAPLEEQRKAVQLLQLKEGLRIDAYARTGMTTTLRLLAEMQYRGGGLPLSHDGYLKPWTLSRPMAQADYIIIDDAYNMNPVLLEVRKHQRCPVGYVDDPY